MNSTNSKRRLKILFLAAWYPSKERPVKGIFIKEHAKAVALYNDVTVIAYSDISKHLRRLYEISENIEDGIRTFRIKQKNLPILKMKYFVRWWSVIRLFRKLYNKENKPDVIHAHVYEAGVPAVILSRLYNIQVVITEHWSGFPRRKLGTFKKLMARFAMKRARIILPVSEDLRKHIEYYGIRNKFRVVPNVVDFKTFYPSPIKINGKDKRKKIFTVASLTPIKGVPYLLEALDRIRERRQDFSLDIVGDGPHRGEYESLATNLGLGAIVTFRGLKSKQQVADFMRRCDFFVLPSLWETFGSVLIEAMASGKPVVATDVGGVKELINKEVGVLIPPKDAEALEKGIEYMLDSCTEYDSKEIERYAKERFSYKAVGRRMDIIYREAL